MSVAINPGSGAVPESTEQHAVDNMGALIADLHERGISVGTFIRRPDDDYGDGRYAFAVVMPDSATHEVQMPGLPLDEVRWLKSEGQDIWQFPRLYVDGSSWIWYFALDQFEDEGFTRRWPDGSVVGGEEIVFGATS